MAHALSPGSSCRGHRFIEREGLTVLSLNHTRLIWVPSGFVMSDRHSTWSRNRHLLMRVCSLWVSEARVLLSMIRTSFSRKTSKPLVAFIMQASMCSKKSRMLGIQPHSIYVNGWLSSRIGCWMPASSWIVSSKFWRIWFVLLSLKFNSCSNNRIPSVPWISNRCRTRFLDIFGCNIKPP
jgi:hypothetical protein